MAHGDAREGEWRGNWRMKWVASTLHTTSEHGVSSITIADAHNSAASNRLNWRPHRFKWTRPFRRKTKPGFCACAITFQTQSTAVGVVSSISNRPHIWPALLAGNSTSLTALVWLFQSSGISDSFYCMLQNTVKQSCVHSGSGAIQTVT